MSAVLAVKELGIEEKDIRTQQLYLSPMYDWNDGKQTLRGYEANQQLAAEGQDLTRSNSHEGGRQRSQSDRRRHIYDR